MFENLEIPQFKIFFSFLFYDVHKSNMFTINLEDGREAPSKASIQSYYSVKWNW